MNRPRLGRFTSGLDFLSPILQMQVPQLTIAMTPPRCSLHPAEAPPRSAHCR